MKVIQKLSALVFILPLLISACQEAAPVSGSGVLLEMLVRNPNIGFSNIVPEGVILTAETVPISMELVELSASTENSVIELSIEVDGNIEHLHTVLNHQEFSYPAMSSGVLDGMNRITITCESRDGGSVDGVIVSMLMEDFGASVSTYPDCAIRRERTNLWQSDVWISTQIPVSRVDFELMADRDDIICVRAKCGFFTNTNVIRAGNKIQVKGFVMENPWVTSLAPANIEMLREKYKAFSPVLEEGEIHASLGDSSWAISVPKQPIRRHMSATWGGLKSKI